MKKIKVIMLALLLAAVSSYAVTYFDETFESYTALSTNLPVTFYTPQTNGVWTNAHVWAVASSSINKGQALEFIDDLGTANPPATGVRWENGLGSANTTSVSSLRFDFTFSPLRTDGPGANYINATVLQTNTSSGSSGGRFVTLRLYENGTARFQAGATVNAVGPYINVASGSVYKVSMYLNDGASAITYTDPLNTSSTNVLAANDAAFYFDNTFITNGGLLSALSTGTAGLGKVGFGTTTAAEDIYYVIDNVRATDVNYVSATEYPLVVNSGSGDGSYTNTQVVAIEAETNPNKTFVKWIGDTATVADTNDPTTTVTMSTNAITVTASYDKGLLTVNNGTAADSGTYLTNGAQRTITANAPGANQTFARWVGNVSTVVDVYSATTTVTIAGLDVALTATYAGFFHDYEDEVTLGVAPTNGSPLMITQYPPSNYVQVVSGTTNTAGTGQAVELKDDSSNGMGFEYNITSAGNSGLSAARVSFAFSWTNLGANAAASMAASFGEYAGSRSMSGSAARWTEARLNDNGTVTVGANGGVPAIDSPIQLINKVANTLNVFANDSDSQSAVYTVNGATYTLPTNSVAYWVSGQLMKFSGASNVSMDLAEVPLAGGTIGTTENNLGKFGFSSGSATLGINYIIDDFQAKALSATPEALYSLVVNFGGSGGLYTSGQQVAISAHPAVGKNFVGWSGDTAALASTNSATTTVTMPAAGVTVTAVYDANVLTVVNGITSGTYTNNERVTIVASNGPANQVFVRWGGTGAAYVTNVLTATSMVIMPAQDITVFPIYAGLSVGFEDEATLGVPPTVGSPIVSTNVLVVAGVTNTAGTGQAIRYIDNDPLVAAGVEYNFANGSPALSAAKASFAFSWNNVGGTNGEQIAASFGEYNGTTSKQLGSAARRWTEARLCNDGTVDFASSETYVVGSETNTYNNNNNALVASNRNTMTIFANDYDSTAVTYSVNSSNYTLPANSVAYWLNGRVITFGANSYPYAPMDVADTNLFNQLIGASEGNLGKFGFSSTSGAKDLDYILDDIVVSADPWASLYALRVIGGDNGGLYTNSQQVTITANPVAGRTFKSWMGDTWTNAAITNTASTTVTMPASGTNGVTLTAIYEDVILTVNNGTGGGTYSEGNLVEINASDLRAGVTFKDWSGSATQYLDTATASPAYVSIPPQDITLTARYYYNLAITNGSGSGLQTNNAKVAIVASNLIGKTFVEWIGDTQLVDNAFSVTDASLTITMSTNPATLTATYSDNLYELTVNSGSGSGSYIYGQEVGIEADAPAPGQMFDQWVGNTYYVGNVYDASTTVTMPASNIAVLATYKDAAVILTATVSGNNGTITPTSASVVPGNSTNFVITANNHYRISTLTTNGTSAGVAFNNLSTNYTYTWNNVQAAGTVTVSFVQRVTTNAPAPVPYSWLAGYFTTNDYDNCANADQDGDGMKTWQEYIALTVPTNKASLFAAAQSNRNVVTWSPVTGRVYSVHWTTNLAGKAFSNKQDNIMYPTNSYTNATPDGRVNLYQVRVRMQ